MSAKLMFQLYMTLSVTEIMARVKCIILMLRHHVILMLHAKYFTLHIKVSYSSRDFQKFLKKILGIPYYSMRQHGRI